MTSLISLVEDANLVAGANLVAEIWQRHCLIFVSPGAWRSLLDRREDLAGEELVAGWVDRGWPLIARRHIADEKDGLALGLPLPPDLGKRRIALLMRPEDIVATRPPLLLNDAINAAPEAWRSSLGRVITLAAQHGIQAQIFGSLLWQSITGLVYITPSSDLDLLLPRVEAVDLPALTSGLAEIEATSPMRIDGELVRHDGAAVNWRELHLCASELLVKTASGAEMIDRASFIRSLPL